MKSLSIFFIVTALGIAWLAYVALYRSGVCSMTEVEAHQLWAQAKQLSNDPLQQIAFIRNHVGYGCRLETPDYLRQQSFPREDR